MSEAQFGRRGTMKPAAKREIERVANDFQSDAAAIEEAPVPLSAHAALYVVLTLLLVAIAWAIIGKVDRIVVAPGKIATRTPMLVMQPFVTSRVVEIAVKAGDRVKKGQLLARFDPTFAQADATSLHQKVASLTVQAERLEAQLSGGTFTAGPGDTPERITQAQIFAHEVSDYRSEIQSRDSRLAQIDSQIRVDQEAIPGIQAQLGMAQRVVDIQNRLRQQQAAAALDVMKAESAAIDATLRLKNTIGDQQKLTQQRAETVQQRQAYMDKWRGDHSQQLVQTRQDLSDAAEQLNKANRMNELTQITAPVDGIVQQVADRSIGSVLRESETLVTLVPDDADLYVEANVPSRDVSYLKVGDSVRVKLESYPFQRFGTITGVLQIISPDSMPLKEGEEQPRVYRAQVRLTGDVRNLLARGIILKPGLVVSAEIKTGERSIAAYMLDPVLRISDESLREP